MKKTNTLFWIFTILFAAFMIFTAIPDVLISPEAEKFMADLGYQRYFLPFIGIAKILGCIAILIPGNYPRIKEWAYAGLAYDLIGAIYSMVAISGFMVGELFMLLPITLGSLSYIFYHKKIKALV
jgi:hypothetical protein